MGSADVVPGVSGGTMAFILGIYEELILSIRTFGQPAFMRAVLSLHLRDALLMVNWKFLVAVFAGILLAIFTLAPGIEWSLENQPVLLWSFFFGLVSASVIVVSKRIQRWTPPLALTLIAGTAFAFWLVGQVPVRTPNDWWFLILSGALAACAMILPGISGSFILVLLGKYEFVISAVNSRDIVSLALIALGAVIGLITLAQVLSWLFKRHHDFTVALLTGFMLGSLRKVWPWKEVVETTVTTEGEVVPLVLNNVFPPLLVNGAISGEVVMALFFAILGFAAVIVIDWLSTRKSAREGVEPALG
jgi:putative membrane protein